MSMIPHVSRAMQTLLTTTTETVAATLGYVKRADRATFTPSTLVQTLVYGWLANPTASLGQLAQMAARVGATVSPQAIDRRFTLATVDLLHHVLLASMEYAISADPVAVSILQRFTSVRIHDSTTIGLPDALATTYRGCGNASARGTAGLKCGVQLDLLTVSMPADMLPVCQNDQSPVCASVCPLFARIPCMVPAAPPWDLPAARLRDQSSLPAVFLSGDSSRP